MTSNGLMWLDYVILFATVAASLGIGLYQARAPQRTTSDYLLGGRNLSVIPVAISLLVTHISVITVLGNGAELHYFGVTYVFRSLGRTGAFLVTAFVIVPLMHPLKLTSINEYLHRRFESRTVALFGCLLQIGSILCVNAVVLLGPCVMLQTMAGFPLWASMLTMGVVTTFYTALGGLKAVVWTDVFQATVMLAGLLTFVIKGAMLAGGFGNVFSSYADSGRLALDISPSFLARQTVWGAFIGSVLSYTSLYAFSQQGMQRYVAVQTLTESRRSVYIAIIPQVIMDGLASMCGLVTYAYFELKGCDPLAAGYIETTNQIVPYFVMTVLSYPGIPGLFISCVVCASLSSLSSALSAAAALAWNDILSERLAHLQENKKAFITKMLSFFFGGLIVLFGFLFANIGGTIIQLAVRVMGSFQAPILILFMLGPLVPRINWKSGLVAALTALVVTSWLVLGSITVKAHQRAKMPTTTANCTGFNGTLLNNTYYDDMISYESSDAAANQSVWSDAEDSSHNSDVHGFRQLYQISHYWVAGAGMLLGLIAGLLSSFLPGFHSTEESDPLLFLPIIRRFLFGKKNLDEKEYAMVATEA